MTAAFTYATDTGTLVIEHDSSHVYIEVSDGDGDAQARIPVSVVPSIVTELLSAAGYGDNERKEKLDELTRTASEDGTADDVDEFVNTRPKFAPGDRVYRRLFPHHGQGTVIIGPSRGEPKVLWDGEMFGRYENPDLLEKAGEWVWV